MALVHTWLDFEAETTGWNATQAREHMNEVIGSSYIHVQVSKWKNGVIPRPTTRAYMLKRCLRFAIKKYPVRTDEQLQVLIEALL